MTLWYLRIGKTYKQNTAKTEKIQGGTSGVLRNFSFVLPSVIALPNNTSNFLPHEKCTQFNQNIFIQG